MEGPKGQKNSTETTINDNVKLTDIICCSTFSCDNDILSPINYDQGKFIANFAP